MADPPAASTPTSRAVGVDEAGEGPGRVRAAADAGDDHVGVGAAEQGPALLAGLVADDPLELADHPRVRVRPHHRAEAVVGGLDGGHPVAQGLVDRVLQRAAARRTGRTSAPSSSHPEHVERLALGVDLAHVHHALEPEERGRRGRGHAVLAGAGLGHQPRLAHLAGSAGPGR